MINTILTFVLKLEFQGEQVNPGGSCPGFSFKTPSDESSLVPLVGGEHVGAVMDAKDGHLLGVRKILQQL